MWSAIRHAKVATLRVGRALSVNKPSGVTSRVQVNPPKFVVTSGLRAHIGRRTFAAAAEAAAKGSTIRRPTRKSATTRKAKKSTSKTKAAPKGRPKKALSAEEKAKLEIRELKKVALLKEPAKLPDRSWVVYASQHLKGEKRLDDLSSIMKSLSGSYRTLSASELESLEVTARQNRLVNAAAYKAWVESYSAEEIAEANRARHRLKRAFKATSRGPIHDERQPKRAISAYIMFTKSRWQSGDFSGRPPSEVAVGLADEWKGMSESERRPFYDSAKADQERYEQEVKAVLNRTVRRRPSPST